MTARFTAGENNRRPIARVLALGSLAMLLSVSTVQPCFAAAMAGDVSTSQSQSSNNSSSGSTTNNNTQTNNGATSGTTSNNQSSQSSGNTSGR